MPAIPDQPRPGLLARLRQILPRPGTAMVHAAAMVIVAGFGLVVWDLWGPNPLRSIRILSVEPPARIVDRSRDGHLIIRRRVCTMRGISVRLIRSWVDAAGAITPTIDTWTWLDEGCRDRPPIHVRPPPSLNEGMHRYRVTVEWCGNIQISCRQYQTEDIEVMILGKTPIGAYPPQDSRF